MFPVPYITKMKTIYSRHQIPLQLVHASTVYKSQEQYSRPREVYSPMSGGYKIKGCFAVCP